jgi:hypothetical protein
MPQQNIRKIDFPSGFSHRNGRLLSLSPSSVAEAAGEINFSNILLWHSQGRRKGDPKHCVLGKSWPPEQEYE